MRAWLPLLLATLTPLAAAQEDPDRREVQSDLALELFERTEEGRLVSIGRTPAEAPLSVPSGRPWRVRTRGEPGSTPVGALAAFLEEHGAPELTLTGAVALDPDGVARLAEVETLRALELWNLMGDLSPETWAALPRLRALERLELSGGPFRDALLEPVGRMSGLRALDLQNCRALSGAGLAHLAGLAQLEELNLAQCYGLEDADLAQLPPLPALRRLDLMIVPELGDDGLAALAGREALEELSLASTGVRGPGLAHLAGLERLRRLDLTGCPVTGADLARLDLERLEVLRLRACERIDDAALEAIAGAEALVRLELTKSRITDAGLAHLAGLARLEVLSVSIHPGASDAGLARLVAALPRLRALGAGSTGFGDRALAAVSGRESLTALAIPDTRVTDAGLSRLELPALRRLDLRSCARITGLGLAGADLPALRTLTLGGTAAGDDALAFAAGTPDLRELDLEGCDAVTSRGLAHLRGLERLRALNLERTSVGSAGLVHLAGLPALRDLDLGLTRVDLAGVPVLARCPGLAKLSLHRARVPAWSYHEVAIVEPERAAAVRAEAEARDAEALAYLEAVAAAQAAHHEEHGRYAHPRGLERAGLLDEAVVPSGGEYKYRVDVGREGWRVVAKPLVVGRTGARCFAVDARGAVYAFPFPSDVEDPPGHRDMSVPTGPAAAEQPLGLDVPDGPPPEPAPTVEDALSRAFLAARGRGITGALAIPRRYAAETEDGPVLLTVALRRVRRDRSASEEGGYRLAVRREEAGGDAGLAVRVRLTRTGRLDEVDWSTWPGSGRAWAWITPGRDEVEVGRDFSSEARLPWREDALPPAVMVHLLPLLEPDLPAAGLSFRPLTADGIGEAWTLRPGDGGFRVARPGDVGRVAVPASPAPGRVRVEPTLGGRTYAPLPELEYHRLRARLRGSADARVLALGPTPAREVAAVEALLDVGAAQARYRAAHVAFAEDPAALVEAGLLPEALRDGVAGGYRFATGPAPDGTPDAWIAVANPVERGVSGGRSFAARPGTVFASDAEDLGTDLDLELDERARLYPDDALPGHVYPLGR